MYQFFHNAAAYLARRNLLCAKPHDFISKGCHAQDEPLFQDTLDVQLINNLDWFRHIHFLDFLSSVGRFARVNDMLARDSVKSRLTSQNGATTSGLSFTEFSYQLMQAYDFSHLHDKKACSVQLGGSDQMGNIMAGIDLIRRQRAEQEKGAANDPSMRADPAYGLTLPLLTTASGAKFGKSAGNAVWVSRSMLSDLDFYQYFVRSSDADVERYLLSLTLMSHEEIAQVMAQHVDDKSKRFAQTRLADEMTELVRGHEACQRAQLATKLLFNTDVQGLTLDQVTFAFQDDPRLVYLDEEPSGIAALAADIGLLPSRSEARRLVQKGGGLYVNGVQVTDVHAKLERQHMIQDRIIVMRAGKSNHKIVVCPPVA